MALGCGPKNSPTTSASTALSPRQTSSRICSTTSSWLDRPPVPRSQKPRSCFEERANTIRETDGGIAISLAPVITARTGLLRAFRSAMEREEEAWRDHKYQELRERHFAPLLSEN